MNLSLLNHPLAYWLTPSTKRGVIRELNKLVSDGKATMIQAPNGDIIIAPVCKPEPELESVSETNTPKPAPFKPDLTFDFDPPTNADEQADRDAYREEQG